MKATTKATLINGAQWSTWGTLALTWGFLAGRARGGATASTGTIAALAAMTTGGVAILDACRNARGSMVLDRVADGIAAACEAQLADMAAAKDKAQRTQTHGAFDFVCPVCLKVSHNPNDRAEGYCPACHDWTGVNAPGRTMPRPTPSTSDGGKS